MPVRLTILLACLVCAARVPAAEIARPLAEARVAIGAELEQTWSLSANGAPLDPIAIDAHSSGSIWGIANVRRRVFTCEQIGGKPRFAAGGEDALLPGLPDRLFARSGLKVFTLDPWDMTIDRFDLTGNRETRLDLRAALAAAGETMGRANDFCLSRSGELFVLDGGRARILTFDDRGALRRVLGDQTGLVLHNPIAIDIDGHGRLYLLETSPAALVSVGLDLRVERRAIGSPGEGFIPRALAVDAWGNAAIAGADTTGLRIVPSDASPSWAPAIEGGLTAGDLAIDPDGRLLVVDARRHGIRVLRLVYRPEEPAAREPSSDR
jgi:hypothetical protein